MTSFVFKREIEDEEFGSQKCIDNTASIKQIAKDLSERGKFSKSYKLYNQLVVPRPTNLCLKHYLVPGHPLKYFKENWDGSVPHNYFEPFPFKCTMPKVLTEVKNLYQYDPVTQLMRAKAHWQKDLVNLKANANKLKCKLEYLNDEVVQCPKYLISIATKLENDPDPNFLHAYNWYYSGNGNMQLICVECVDYLLCSELNSVYLSRFYNDNLFIENYHSAKYDCGNDINILETICSSHNIVVLRTKNKIIVLKIVKIDDIIVFEDLKTLESESTFTSISFDKHHTNILYVTTLDSKLTIVNIDRMTGRSVKLKHHSESLINNWNSVMGAERGTFMHVERNAITQYDKRTNTATTSWSGVKDIADMTSCNSITAARYCDDSPSLYFATDHQVFLMDTRASRNTNLKVVQRWMHGLQTAPTIISIAKSGQSKECIILTSQGCQDMCVISNDANSVLNNCESIGVSMPYHPPGIINVFNKARLKILCFDICNPVNQRIATSTTGLTVMEQNENCCILTQNALGDIFLRTLYPPHMDTFIRDDSVEVLHKWSQSFKVKSKIFEVSGMPDIADIWKNLKKLPDTYYFGSKKVKDQYRQSEIFEAFKNEELIPELLDIWINEQNDNNHVDKSLMLNVQED